MARQKYLLDTCICVYWLRDKFNVKDHVNRVGLENCYISEITVAELKFGKEYGRLKGGPKYKDQSLDEFFNAINVIPVSPFFDKYAEEKARLAIAGTPTGDFDLLIGCTAVARKMVMVTQNIKDFEHIKNICLENWIKED
jgi:tRNA(fMet)-specific endonuclease VapC